MNDDKKQLRSDTGHLSWSGFFGRICVVTLLIFLLLLTAVPFVFGFGVLTFSGEDHVRLMIKVGFANTVVFCLSCQGYLIARWIENRKKNKGVGSKKNADGDNQRLTR